MQEQTTTQYTAQERMERERHAGNGASISTLIGDLTRQMVRLVRQEVELAKVEMADKARIIGRNAVAIVAGAAVAWAGVLALVATVTAILFVALWNTMPFYHALWLSPLIVAVVLGIVGYALIQKGIRTIKRTDIMPHQTVETLREDKEWLKNEIK